MFSTLELSEPKVRMRLCYSPPVSNLTVFNIYLKGKVARDFPPPFFFHQKYPPWTMIHILSFFKFGFEVVELLQLQFDSPLHHAEESQSHRCILQRGVKSSH
jgi:hypothetical protein